MLNRTLFFVGAVLTIVTIQWWNLRGSYQADLAFDSLFNEKEVDDAGSSKPSGPPRETISRSQAMSLDNDFNKVKLSFSVYFAENGRLPHSTTDLQLGEYFPKNFRILQNGALEALVDNNPNARLYWRFVPSNSMGAQQWDCLSPTIVNIAEYLRDCRYDLRANKDEPIRMDYARTDSLLFEFDRADEEGLANGELNGFKEFLRRATPSQTLQVLGVRLTGYADPIGNSTHNIRLAEKRAAYAREAFATIGIDRALINIRVIGVDPTPVRTCAPDLPRDRLIECYGRSRRVDIELTLREDI